MLTKIPAALATLVLGSGAAAVAYATASGADPAPAAVTPAPTVTQQTCAAPGEIVDGVCVVVVKDAPATLPAAAGDVPADEATTEPSTEATLGGSGRDHLEDDSLEADDDHDGSDSADDDSSDDSSDDRGQDNVGDAADDHGDDD